MCFISVFPWDPWGFPWVFPTAPSKPRLPWAPAPFGPHHLTPGEERLRQQKTSRFNMVNINGTYTLEISHVLVGGFNSSEKY